MSVQRYAPFGGRQSSFSSLSSPLRAICERDKTTRRRARTCTGGVVGSRKVPVMSGMLRLEGLQTSFHHPLSLCAMLSCSSASGCRITATGTALSASREHCSCACMCPSVRDVRACVRLLVHAHARTRACARVRVWGNVALRAPKPRRVKSKHKCKSLACSISSTRCPADPPAPLPLQECSRADVRPP